MASTTKAAPKKALQRKWKVGSQYTLEGTGKRKLKLIGRGKIGGREVLMFHPVRAAKKTKP